MKDVPGYEGRYAATIDGRIWSYPNRRRFIGKFLKLSPRNKKVIYLKVVLVDKEGKLKTYFVHRIVADTYLEKYENKPQINHKNGIKTDNRVENLEWVDRSENMIHAYLTGLQKPQHGSKSHLSKLNEKKVIEIRKLHKMGIKLEVIAKNYNICRQNIWFVVSKKTWKHI